LRPAARDADLPLSQLQGALARRRDPLHWRLARDRSAVSAISRHTLESALLQPVVRPCNRWSLAWAWQEPEEQAVDIQAIQEQMAVVGADGEHVGTVDKVEDDQIKLTRKDPTARGQHHYIPVSWVASVEGAVRLNVTSQEAIQGWQSEGEHEDPYAANRDRSVGGEVY
jgi:hypothetical protein